MIWRNAKASTEKVHELTELDAHSFLLFRFQFDRDCMHAASAAVNWLGECVWVCVVCHSTCCELRALMYVQFSMRFSNRTKIVQYRCDAEWINSSQRAIIIRAHLSLTQYRRHHHRQSGQRRRRQWLANVETCRLRDSRTMRIANVAQFLSFRLDSFSGTAHLLWLRSMRLRYSTHAHQANTLCTRSAARRSRTIATSRHL